MVRAGYSPSVRLFEAAACGVPILTDEWPGLEQFFKPGTEILPVRETADVTSYLQMPEERRQEIADRARRRALRFHTAAVRAEEFEASVLAIGEKSAESRKKSRAALRRSPAAASR
jgi:spore maturation protein CgeB